MEPPSIVLRRVGPPVLIALLTAAVLCLPSFLMPLYRNFYERKFPQHFSSWPLNGRFTHFAWDGEHEDEITYAARALESARHGPPYSPYVLEDRSPRLLSRDLLSFLMLGVFFRTFADPDQAWVAARFVFLPLAVLCIYGLLLLAEVRPRQALFAAVVLILFNDALLPLVNFTAPLVGLKTALRHAFWLLGPAAEFIGPTRFVNPCLSVPLLLSASLLAIQISREEPALAGSWRLALLSGILGGSLAYVHTDVWAVFVVAITLTIIRASLSGKAFHRPLFMVCALTAVISLPWYLLNGTPDLDTLLRGQVVFERRFYPSSLFYFAAAFLLLRCARRNATLSWCAAVAGGAGLLLNASLIRGYSLPPSYWYSLGNLFLFLALAVAVLRRLEDGERWAWLTALALTLAFGRSVAFSGQLFHKYGMPKDYETAFQWLDRNAAPDSVVATLDGEVALMLPVFSHTKVLTARNNPLVTSVTSAENMARAAYGIELFAPPPLRAAAVDWFSRVGPLDFSPMQWFHEPDRTLIDKEPSGFLVYYLDIRDTAASRSEKLRAGLTAPRPASYRVDYLWEGPIERRLRGGPRGAPPGAGEMVYQNPTVRLYRRAVTGS